MTDPSAFCAAMDAWAALRSEADGHFAELWRDLRLQISKSCLLDRMMYGGEKPSKTPCPVHKGRWSGIHIGWPGTFWTHIKTGEKTPVKESPYLREYFDAGCRCFQHRCGCTTGWQPDEYCGCLPGDSEPAARGER